MFKKFNRENLRHRHFEDSKRARRFREKFEMHEHIKENYMKNNKFSELYFLARYMHVFRKITVIFTAIIILFMFKVLGFRAASVSIVIILVINQIFMVMMMVRLEKRFIAPMSKLQYGVKKISDGDYSVRLKVDQENEVGILTVAFNDMASKLEDGERIKKEYEYNRKELIANISHDLKTPITSINGYVEALLEDVVPKEKIDSYLKTISSNAGYMNRLIDDLFLFSKLDMQKIDFTFVETNIKNYMSDIVEEFEFILSEKGINFNYKDTIDEDLFVNIDGKRLYRSIRNIVDNAIKYGDIGSKNLSIEIDLKADEEFVFINLMDNGPGIEEEKIDKIFERFYRIDKERTKDLSSTGLGLAIAKEIVDAHKGYISVKSKINFGSVFTIKLLITNEKGDV